MPALLQITITALMLSTTAVAAAQGIPELDVTQPGRPLPHFWETVFGSGRASLSLRESYRRDLCLMKEATRIEYVRLHAIFHDENGVYSEDGGGRPCYNWAYIDQIYDGLLENGVHPFVELSFMPCALAISQAPHPFWYRLLPSPPKDYGRWEQLIEQFARHLVRRYGIDEVSQWYFEVWNEPNIDFWSGEPKADSYHRLYAVTVRALKRVSPRLRVGGPATAQAAWVDRFIEHCYKNGLPLDFVSTHIYGNDRAAHVFGGPGAVTRRDMVAMAVDKVWRQVKASAVPDLPIHWTEYNASYMNEVNVTDSPFTGPWLADTIRQCDGTLASLAYWTFSDVIEEQGVVRCPFYGGYGLIAAGHIPKASFNAFALLSRLGDVRLALDADFALATRRGDGSLALALWNYAAPEEEETPKELRVRLRGMKLPAEAWVTVVDAEHGSPLRLWESMGRPEYPTREQQEVLRRAAQLPAPRVLKIGQPEFSLLLEPKALALVEFR